MDIYQIQIYKRAIFKIIFINPRCKYLYIEMSTSIQQFKQQTFALIKQQATKLKTHSKQIQIKQQQIRFLKETIQTLQEERDESERVKMNLRNKIDLIMKEVSSYNDNVVHKIHAENETLLKRVNQLEPNLEESLETIKRLTKQLQISEEKLQKFAGQSGHYKQNAETRIKELEKLRLENIKLKQQTSQLQKYVCKLQAQNQQLENKVKSSDKQIDNLVSKCQQTVNNCQKKMKNLKDGLIKKEQFTKLQGILQMETKKYEEQKKQKDKLSRQKNQLVLTTKILKEKQISNQRKYQIQKSLLEADLRNLKDSCKISKKICQFESNYSNIFDETFQLFIVSNFNKQQNEKKLQILQQKLIQTERILSQKQQNLQQAQHQLELMAEKLRAESQTIQSSYEGKILQLSIKIKKQEKALQQLAIKDRQFQSLHQQYEKLAQEHVLMKQTLQNTIFQYKKQNEKLSTQIQQLIHLCDENINTKNSLNCLKHSINNLLAVVYFLHLNLVRARQARRKLYQPFIDFYFKTRYALQKSNNANSYTKKPIQKLRTCVVMILAIKRMEKGAMETSNSGLYRYVEKAIKSKGKIEDLTQYLQNLLQKAIKNEKNIVDLLKQNKTVYKWSCLHNYLKINLPTNWYQNALQK